MKWYEDPDLIAERDAWYAKLKADGFKDIEQPVGDGSRFGDLLLGVSPGDLRRRLYSTESEDYYRFARQHVHSLPFGLERAVWEHHSEGLSYSKIRQALLRSHGKVGERVVKRVIHENRERMLGNLAEEADRNAKAAIAAWEDSDG